MNRNLTLLVLIIQELENLIIQGLENLVNEVIIDIMVLFDWLVPSELNSTSFIISI